MLPTQLFYEEIHTLLVACHVLTEGGFGYGTNLKGKSYSKTMFDVLYSYFLWQQTIFRSRMLIHEAINHMDLYFDEHHVVARDEVPDARVLTRGTDAGE